MTATEEKVRLKPVHDKIFVEIEAKGERKTAGGIVIPETASHGTAVKTETAIVKAVGRGKVNRKGVLIAPEVNPGDKVLIKRHMGTEMHDKGAGRHYVICEPADILAVMT